MLRAFTDVIGRYIDMASNRSSITVYVNLKINVLELEKSTHYLSYCEYLKTSHSPGHHSLTVKVEAL